MGYKKNNNKDFELAQCVKCKKKYTKAMMMNPFAGIFKCIRCYNGGKIYEGTIKFINSIIK